MPQDVLSSSVGEGRPCHETLKIIFKFKKKKIKFEILNIFTIFLIDINKTFSSTP